MMRLDVILAAIAAAAAAATPASAMTRDWPLAGFEAVRLDGAADVTITAGPRFAVHADGDPALVGALVPEVRAGTLVLGFHGPVRSRGEKLRIAITLPRLSAVTLHGAGRIHADRADAPMVALTVDGTGSVEVAQLRAERTALTLSGTGQLVVAGTTGQLDARKSGVGSIGAEHLLARSATLTASGIGSLDAHVNGPATVSLSGIGSVSVAGHPRCTIHRSGIGSVDCAS